MQTNQLDRGKLRELANLHPEGAKVLSLYLNLDPTEFASPQARNTEIHSLLDEADRRLRNGNHLTHDEDARARGLQRVRDWFDSPDARPRAPTGSRSSARARRACLRCSSCRARSTRASPSTTSPSSSRSPTPFSGELGGVPREPQAGPILRGSRERLDEVAYITDDVHGWHDKGGWF